MGGWPHDDPSPVTKIPISRRAVLAAPALLVAAAPAPALPIPPGRRLEFAIFRHGSRVGTHIVNFTGDQQQLEVRISVDLKVTFGPFVLYHYSLQGLEQWRDGVLVHAASNTNDNGTPKFARATLEGGRLHVSGSLAKPYIAPPGATPSSHWNEDELNHPMINAENGALMHVMMRDKGMEDVPNARGGTIRAHHYALMWYEIDTKPRPLDLWYEPNRLWAAMTAAASDGSLIVYRRLVP